MAGEAYYYFISIILVLGIILYLVNLIEIRARGKSTFGQFFEPGTEKYKRVARLASNRNLTITSFLTLAFTVNLIYSIYKVVHIGGANAHFLLIFAPIATILSFAVMIAYMRKQYAEGRPQ